MLRLRCRLGFVFPVDSVPGCLPLRVVFHLWLCLPFPLVACCFGCFRFRSFPSTIACRFPPSPAVQVVCLAGCMWSVVGCCSACSLLPLRIIRPAGDRPDGCERATYARKRLFCRRGVDSDGTDQTKSRAICTALRAAPLRIWSATHQKVSPLGEVRSRRMRPT